MDADQETIPTDHQPIFCFQYTNPKCELVVLWYDSVFPLHRLDFVNFFKGNWTSGSCLSERLVVPLHQTLRYKHEAALSGRGLMNGAFCSVSHLVHCTARGGCLAWLLGKCAVCSPTCTSRTIM